MRTLKDIILESKKEYKYTIKLALADMSADQKSMVENELKKYNLESFSGFKKTAIQQNPLDFPNVKNVRVYISDVTVCYPFTTDTMERVISEALGVSRQFVIVYAGDDPRKQYTQDYLERNDPSFKEKYVPKLGNEDTKPKKQDPLHGDKFIAKVLADAEKKRKDQTTVKVHEDGKLFPKQKVEKPIHTAEKSKINTKAVIGGQNTRKEPE